MSENTRIENFRSKSSRIDDTSPHDIMRKLRPGGRALPLAIHARRHELTRELQKYMHVLGPTPKRCLETLADLGLSDSEIACYFKVPNGIITDLRQVWKIGDQL